MELFLHPWYMVAGGALISSPIIIHLINRMRFKRVRWAAMEFLLKSQKRNRRRLIIEQLILLLLRILLVLLIAFLVARFIGGVLGGTGQGSMHVVVLDDTPSMGDRWNDNGEMRNSLNMGKDQIKQLAKMAALANSAQVMQVYRLSDLASFKITDKSLEGLARDGVPGTVLAKLRPVKDETFARERFLETMARVLTPEELTRSEAQLLKHADAAKPIYDKRLDDRTEEDLNRALEGVGTTALHVDPIQAISKAHDVFNSVPQKQKTLHLVSDFRATDWASGSQVEKLNEKVAKLLDAGINFSVMDMGHPFRNPTSGVALNHDNLAIVDFRAESRMAAEGVPIELTVTIRNYGSKDDKTFLHVYVDGVPEYLASVPLERVPANDKLEQKFTLMFQKKKATPEFVHVAAEINREETGLQVDNVRDLVIEVRKKIPALIVDGAGREGQKPGGDSFHLEIGLLSSRAFEAEYKTLDELDKLNLDSYPSLYLVNIPQIKSKETLDKLQKYVQNGGSIAYFLGDKAISSFYNDTLHRDYKGLFPVKIAQRYTEPLTPEEREIRKQKDPQPKILFRKEDHPLVKEGLVPFKTAFRFLLIDRYWPTLPRSQWNPEDQKEKVEEVITLPNRNSVDAYKDRARELGKQAQDAAEELASTDKQFQKYADVIRGFRRQLTQALSTELLFNVVTVLDKMLEDPGEANNLAKPNMPELWAQPRMKALGGQIKEFRETILYGDPLVVTRSYGKGRVAVCLTTAGTASKWNEWGGGGPVSWSYPVFIRELQRYLTSESADLNRIVTGDAAIRLEFDAEKFREEVDVKFQPQPDLEARKQGDNPDARPEAKTFQMTMYEQKKTAPMGEDQKVRVLKFDNARQPGVYTFEIKPVDSTQPSEFRSFAFNVDAEAESNLKRAEKDKLGVLIKTKEARAGQVKVFAPGDDLIGFKQRDPDASEMPWLYLLILIVLIVEQALAVHLSFHLKPSDQAAAAPARPQPAAA